MRKSSGKCALTLHCCISVNINEQNKSEAKGPPTYTPSDLSALTWRCGDFEPHGVSDLGTNGVKLFKKVWYDVSRKFVALTVLKL